MNYQINNLEVKETLDSQESQDIVGGQVYIHGNRRQGGVHWDGGSIHWGRPNYGYGNRGYYGSPNYGYRSYGYRTYNYGNPYRHDHHHHHHNHRRSYRRWDWDD